MLKSDASLAGAIKSLWRPLSAFGFFKANASTTVHRRASLVMQRLLPKLYKEITLNLVHWNVRNSHRADVQIDESLGRFSELQGVEPLPSTERPMHKWNGNPYRLDAALTAWLNEDATFFLPPYWLARFHRLIEEV